MTMLETRMPDRTAPAPAAYSGWTLALSVLALGLMVVTSVVGLLVDGGYGGPASVAATLRGYDLVTLAVVVPVGGVALAYARRGSVVARLVWAGMLAAAVYTYAYYLFGTEFNDGFLLHTAAFSGCLFALVLTLAGLDAAGIAGRFSPRTPVRWVSGLLALLAAGLGGMWVFFAARFALTGDTPPGSALVETPTVVHLGYALDLAVLVPVYAMAAVLLWRRAGWGYVLAAVALLSGTVHQIGYLVAMPFQVAAGVPEATAFDPSEPPIAAAFAIAAGVLLAGLRRASAPVPPARPGGRTPRPAAAARPPAADDHQEVLT